MSKLEQQSKPNKEKLGIKPVKVDYKGDDKHIAEKKLNAVKNNPTVYYYGILLPPEYIKEITIDSNKFMPICYVCFHDVYAMLDEIGFPTDNAKLTIIIPTNDDKFGQIFMDFKIQKYEIDLIRNTEAKKIHMWGICNVDNLLIQQYKSYESQSSFDIFRSIANDSGLGFLSNINSTQDKQTWINHGREVYKFIQDTTNTAWNGENSYLWSFVDLYYNFNYIDVENSLNQDIKEILWYSTSVINRSNNGLSEQNTKSIKPFLSNEMSLKNTNLFFTGEKILNQSTSTSLKRGYLRKIHYYDKDGNWGKKAGKYNTYDLDTITSSGSQRPAIYLKGDPGSTEFYSKNNKNYYIGNIDTINMHPDFLWAKMQNSENLNDLQKICMQITLPQPNFNIKRFEKIDLQFINKTNNPGQNGVNFKLNGEWLCTGISFFWNGASLYQKVNIVKREITITDV